MNLANSCTIRRLAMIEAAISVNALTCNEIAVDAHMSREYAGSMMAELRRMGMVHIAGWKLSRTMWGATYRWGRGRNVPRPKPRSKARIQRDFRARVKADEEKNDLFLARARARDRAQRAAKGKPKSWLSALEAR